MQKKWTYVTGIILLAFLGFYFFQKFRVAPDLTLSDLPIEDLNGQTVLLSKFKGQKTVLCFSASWCGPCRKELKTIGKIKNDQLAGLNFVVISDESTPEIEAMKEEFPFDYTWLRLRHPFSSIGINSIPTTYLLNKAGTIVKKKVGYIDWEDPSNANYLSGLMD